MNNINRLEECTKNRHLLRIEKVKSIHPNLCPAQKGGIPQLFCKAFHTIRLIGQASLHTRGEIVHNECKLLELLRKPPLRMFAIIGSIAQNLGTQSVAFEFGNGACQCLGKTALADRARKYRKRPLVLQQNILEEDTSADIADARQMCAPGLEEYLPCKAAKTEYISLQKTHAVRQRLCEGTLCGIGHVLGDEENTLLAQRGVCQLFCHRRKTGMRLARTCTANDKLEFCRHNASKPPCVKRALLPFAVRSTSRWTGIRARSSST